MAVWRLQVNTGGANVADYCLQNHVAALGGWQGTCYGAFTYLQNEVIYGTAHQKNWKTVWGGAF